MSILTDKPDDFVVIENKKYPIHTDFRNWIKIDSVLADGNMSYIDKIVRIFPLCFKCLPENIGQALNAVTEFYYGKKRKGQNKKSKRVYDFEYDADFIYASFMSEYGIDLQNTDMHWHSFKALLNGLGSECIFSKVIAVRQIKLSDVPEKQRRVYAKLKQIYALPGCYENEEDIAECFEKSM